MKKTKAKQVLAKYYDVDNSVDEYAIIQAMKEYAIEVAKEALNTASKNATMLIENPSGSGKFLSGQLAWIAYGEEHLEIDKDSILSENNIPTI